MNGGNFGLVDKWWKIKTLKLQHYYYCRILNFNVECVQFIYMLITVNQTKNKNKKINLER